MCVVNGETSPGKVNIPPRKHAGVHNGRQADQSRLLIGTLDLADVYDFIAFFISSLFHILSDQVDC